MALLFYENNYDMLKFLISNKFMFEPFEFSNYIFLKLTSFKVIVFDLISSKLLKNLLTEYKN